MSLLLACASPLLGEAEQNSGTSRSDWPKIFTSRKVLMKLVTIFQVGSGSPSKSVSSNVRISPASTCKPAGSISHLAFMRSIFRSSSSISFHFLTNSKSPLIATFASCDLHESPSLETSPKLLGPIHRLAFYIILPTSGKTKQERWFNGTLGPRWEPARLSERSLMQSA